MDIRQYNDWFNYISQISEKERAATVKEVIDDLKWRAKTEKNKKIADLVKLLEDKSKCKVVGFMPYIEYTRAFGGKEMLEANYLHAWGGMALVCVLKNLPGVLIVGADIEWTDHEGFKG